ncbi:hypothetical protein [Paraburkholderia atlantica]|nr:hypothetical protein [Paraburkholderia atlantica]MBB5508113.1 hypothetical protein [Paraburkholderia atlantica]
MSEASERWLSDMRAWLDEQMRQQEAQDEAAWLRFKAQALEAQP